VFKKKKKKEGKAPGFLGKGGQRVSQNRVLVTLDGAGGIGAALKYGARSGFKTDVGKGGR